MIVPPANERQNYSLRLKLSRQCKYIITIFVFKLNFNDGKKNSSKYNC